MKAYKRPTNASIGALLLGVATLSITPHLSQAQAAKKEHKVTLRAIMQELGAEYLRLTDALLVEDFKGLEESATAIQTHPLPDEIVTVIKNKRGDRRSGNVESKASGASFEVRNDLFLVSNGAQRFCDVPVAYALE